MDDKNLTAEQLWARYQYWNARKKPWNQKGTSHKPWFEAKRYAALLPFHFIVTRTLRVNARKVAENIWASNTLLKRLRKNQHG